MESDGLFLFPCPGFGFDRRVSRRLDRRPRRRSGIDRRRVCQRLWQDLRPRNRRDEDGRRGRRAPPRAGGCLRQRSRGRGSSYQAARPAARGARPGMTESPPIDALAMLRAGDVPGATDAFSARVAANPRDADALHWLGVIAIQAGAVTDAIKLLGASTEARPTFADAWANLATAHDLAGDLASAESAARRAVELDPTQAIAHFNLGNLLAKKGQHRNAVGCFNSAIERRPAFPEAFGNLGIARRELNDLAGAIAAFERARDLAPNARDARYNLANAFRDSGRLTDAERELRAALDIDPTYARAWNTLGNLRGDMAQPEAALAAFDKARAAAPHWAAAASNRLSALHYIPGQTAAALGDAHRRWAQEAGFDLKPPDRFKTWDRTRDRRLRVGFVSPDFGLHPVGLLSVGLFERLDRTKTEPVIFSLRRGDREDDISRRIAANADWVRAAALTDSELEHAIRSRSIDILFDMSGHTNGHRLQVFAHRAAPLQISWIGYVGTTGLAAMDYVLADNQHVPTGTDLPGPEAYLRMPNGYVCFDRHGVPVPRLRPAENPVTFGCFNNPAKLNNEVVASFARILQRTHRTRLILAFRWLDDPGVASGLRQAFDSHGIAATRIEIRGGAPRERFLANYDDIDLALDTFPYSGGLTTCEALAM
ncbi:MAG: tetratricopeptide repeat protein, partial [Alphaproteobacteria bacterium]|nr:tetratricopeptide repeat protein [Alphaproteobacteria bacterium]